MTKWQAIEEISKKDKLLRLLERYNKIGLRDISEEQANEFLEEVKNGQRKAD